MKKKIVKIIGIIIVLLSFAFLIHTFMKMDIGKAFSVLRLYHIPIIIGLSLFYSLANGILAFNWAKVLEIIAGHKIIKLKFIKAYLKTSIAKYLPSNLMHFATRHAAGYEQGFTHKKMLLSNMMEIAYLILTSGIIISLSLALRVIKIPETLLSLMTPLRLAISIIVLLSALAALVIFLKPSKIIGYIKELISLNKIPGYIFVGISYIFYFAITSIVLIFIFGIILKVDINAVNIMYIYGGFTLAWLSGYLIPGAPGGLGVRELMLLVIFTPLSGESGALIASIILRLITISGDIFTFLTGLLIKDTSVKSSS